MSLFDQAISRLRNQAAGDKVNDARESPAESSRGDTRKPTKQMTLSLDALRALGYLPEESLARQFANHYRRIKRPLVDKAMSDEGTLRPRRVIMVTSALPGDGKTFTTVNLALSLALERDLSVLLVDCDVLRRHISDIFGVLNERGLLDGLTNQSVDLESLVIGTNLRGLSILPAGTPVGGTAELMNSNRMRSVVAALCAHSPRRLLLLDSPPLLLTDEARALVKIAGQVALVVRADHTPRQAVLDAISMFHPEQAGGIILNDVHVSRSEAYYSYGYGSYGPDGPDGDGK
jgi:exopolysaccharide/PEP-CTERM locus tyrosine autokinase